MIEAATNVSTMKIERIVEALKSLTEEYAVLTFAVPALKNSKAFIEAQDVLSVVAPYNTIRVHEINNDD